MEVPRRDDPPAGMSAAELSLLPAHERSDRLVGEAESAEEPNPFTALHASGGCCDSSVTAL